MAKKGKDWKMDEMREVSGEENRLKNDVEFCPGQHMSIFSPGKYARLGSLINKVMIENTPEAIRLKVAA
jgi:hypothetical protein